jgi:hypothetical protein
MTFASWAAPGLAKWLARIPKHATITLRLRPRSDGLEDMLCEAVLPDGSTRHKTIREPKQ